MQVINYMDVHNDPGKVNKMTLVDHGGTALHLKKKILVFYLFFFLRLKSHVKICPRESEEPLNSFKANKWILQEVTISLSISK